MTYEDPDLERSYWNPQVETLGTEEMRAIQEKKLLQQIRYLNDHSVFYSSVFDKAGFAPGDIRSIEYLKQLPFTTKQDLRRSLEQDPPFGTHLAAPINRVVRVTTTAGTTGKAMLQAYTQKDTMRRSESVCRALWSFGVRPGDRVINGFALSLFNAGIPFCAAVEHLGAVNIPVGAEAKPERLLITARELKANVLMSTPSFAAYLAEKAPELIGMEAKELAFRIICGGGEPGFEIPGVRKELERAWGTSHIYDLASTSDAHPNSFANCYVREGKHHLTPDLVLVQLIDPETNNVIEMVDGAQGEYIFTHLDREACPLLRYRTGDVIRINAQPCECGRTGIRVEIIGRTDDMLIIQGMNVFPSAIQAVVSSFSPKTTGNLRILLDAPGPGVKPPMHIEVECNQDLGTSECETLKETLENAIRTQLHFTPRVEIVPYGALERTTTKTKLIVTKD